MSISPSGAPSGVGVLEGSILEGACHYIAASERSSGHRLGHEYAFVHTHLMVLLHALMLYDTLVVDESTVRSSYGGLREMVVRNGTASKAMLPALGRFFYGRDCVIQDQVQPAPEEHDAFLEVFAEVFRHKVRRAPPESALTRMTPAFSYADDWLDDEFGRRFAGHGIEDRHRQTCVFLYRGLCYAGYSNRRALTTGSACAYVASPGRMLALSEFLDPAEIEELAFVQRGYWDLLDRLFLPRGGYSFGRFAKTFEPLRASAASASLMRSTPVEALARVLRMRDTEEGRAVRRDWARRVWGRSLSAAEGVVGPAFGVIGSSIEGDLSLVVHQTVVASANGEREMAAKMEMRNVRSGGKAEMRSDAPVDMLMDRIDAAGDVRQVIEVVATRPEVVADGLAKLRAELQAYDPSAKDALARLEAAEGAAREGDAGGIVEHLKGLGRWVGDFATKVGVSVVAKIIEKNAGL